MRGDSLRELPPGELHVIDAAWGISRSRFVPGPRPARLRFLSPAGLAWHVAYKPSGLFHLAHLATEHTSM